MTKYIVREQINYPSPFMEINNQNFSSAFNDKEAAYQHYNDLVNKYDGNNLVLIKITLIECDTYMYTYTEGDTANIIESWSNTNNRRKITSNKK